MGSKQMSHINAGTGHSARPGADGSSTVATKDWESWYKTSGLDRRAPARRGPGTSAAAAGSWGWRRAATVFTGAAAVLAVFSAGVLYADVRRPQETAAASTSHAPLPLPVRTATAPPAPTATVMVQAPSNVPVVAPVGAARGAPPVKISIPALKISQRLIGLRVNANRQLDVPQDYDDIGWWSTGPVAGDPGAAVIVGHVDSTVGPAVFSGLSSLTKGATVAVVRADGTTAKFKVTKLQSFPKEHFPDKLVYRTSGRPSLHLVTCGGSYDRSTGYRDNVVVFADMVRPPPTAQPKTARRKASAPVKAHPKTTSRTNNATKSTQRPR